MKHFRKVWTPEINQWLVEHKDMIKNEMYKLFLETYPECNDVTYTAFKNQCSRVGASYTQNNCWRGSRKPRPLYSEQIKKNYVRIKIAEPNVWMQKNKWVYIETHPWEDCSERSNYVFLDGDNRNFNPNNIERVPLKVMGVFNLMGGCEKGNPEITKLRILNAKLKLAILDKGEEMGLVAKVDSKGRKKAGRCFIEERNRKAREYNSSPERKKIIAERTKEYLKRLKTENPEKYAEMREKHKVYSKEYHKRKKESGC